MASLIRQPNGGWQVQYTLGGKRPIVRLGKVSKRDADKARECIEALVIAKAFTRKPDEDVQRWVAIISDGLHARLRHLKLVGERVKEGEDPQAETVGTFLACEIPKACEGVKPETVWVYKHIQRNLLDFFGPDKVMRKITRGDALDFVKWLKTKKGLADNTVRRRTGLARQFFEVAVAHELIPSSPFGKRPNDKSMPCNVRENEARKRFIGREEIERVIEACPDAEWRVIVALARYGGVRCPSEVLPLKWSDIDWKRGRVRITSPKTEHHPGHESREIPLFPELRLHLQELFEQAPEGQESVITRYRPKTRNLNLGTQFRRIIRKAGLKPWPKLFHNLRASRETELALEFPLHVVTKWIGNSAVVAHKHYLTVTDADYEAAAGGQKAMQKAMHAGAESSRDVPRPVPGDGSKSLKPNRLRLDAAGCDITTSVSLGVTGHQQRGNSLGNSSDSEKAMHNAMQFERLLSMFADYTPGDGAMAGWRPGDGGGNV